MSRRAGHDIDYIALSGTLHAIGPADGKPVVPLNLVGDFGGGGMLLAFGVAAALVSAARTGRGQVVDAAMTDGVALLTAMFHGLLAAGLWQDRRGANLLDGAAPFYDTYETSDGKFLAVGAIEPKFYAELLDKLGLAGEDLPEQMDQSRWPELRRRIADVVRTRMRDEWESVFAASDACVAPVLSLSEAPRHAQNAGRRAFVEAFGVIQPAPAPRFQVTPGAIAGAPPLDGGNTRAVLSDCGFGPDEIRDLLASGAARQA